MNFCRIYFIFFLLMLMSFLGNTATSAEKSSSKRNATTAVPGRSPASSPTANTAAPIPKEGVPPSSLSKNDSALDSGKSDAPTVVEDPPSIKGVKKRGASVAGANQAEEGPSSLFEDEKGFLAGLDYPELQVVPRASERLQMEAQEERNSFLSNYWPVQISAIALVLAGSSASGKYKEPSPTDDQKAENQLASQMGMLIGGMWLGTTYYLDHSLSYGKALPEIRKINGKDKKSQLLKERLSEEALERPAKVATMINNLSVWSTLTLALYLNAHSSQTMPSFAGLALGLSFLPWLIDNRIIENWQKHQEYKRKIYAPITKIDLTLDPVTHQPTPLLSLQWRF